MSEINIAEGDQFSVATELANLMKGAPFTQVQFDNLCRFMIYFSLAELKIEPMKGGFGNTDILARFLIDKEGIDDDVIEDCYLFFINRYRDQPDGDNRLNELAPLAFVKNGARDRFIELIKADMPTKEEKVSLVFKVIFRLRHNLFHGEKWSYYLKDQDANFSHSVSVLLSTLTLTRGTLWHP